jgi:excisionase family DNA binding protein
MLLSVKELAEELGISVDSVYRAYRKGEIPAVQICRMIRFDFEKVRLAMEQKAKRMPYQRCTQRATGGESRRRATPTRPRVGNTGALTTVLVLRIL